MNSYRLCAKSMLEAQHSPTPNFCTSKAIFIHFNSIWCKNPVSALFGEILQGQYCGISIKGRTSTANFRNFFGKQNLQGGWYLNLTEKIPQDSNWRARQLKIGSYSTKLQWVTKSTYKLDLGQRKTRLTVLCTKYHLLSDGIWES